MGFVLAQTFTKALARLSADEQKQTKITVVDVQTDPEGTGLSLHRIDRSRDPDFWSARVSRDLRLVLHKRGASTVIAYVGHHDDAYAWAERRRIEDHPRTGALQIVELRERVEDIVVHRVVEADLPPALAGYGPGDALSWGVPEDWVKDVLAATEDEVLDIAAHLPEEAAEAVLRAASGEAPLSTPPAQDGPEGVEHPDARRRFRLIGDQAELALALDAPWDAWTIFLHPAQRAFAERPFAGPARVVGSAGTGKTVVALHRAVRLAREGGRVLLSTFSPVLAEDLAAKTDRLAGDAAWRSRIRVATMNDAVRELLPDGLALAAPGDVAEAIAKAAAGAEVTEVFVEAEWRLIVDAWAVPDLATYRNLPRLGRGARLAASGRDAVWPVFEEVRAHLADRGLVTPATAMHEAAARIRAGELAAPYDHVVMDEAQDVSPPELVLLAAMAGGRANGLFFAGDIGQRIFRAPFPWSRAGVDVRGRSATLKVNYRTSHEIRRQSETLLPRRLVEADGGEEDRRGVTSVFHGPAPVLRAFADARDETDAAITWAHEHGVGDDAEGGLAILVRSADEMDRARTVAEALSRVSILEMHDAKGREFRTVMILGCDEGVIPSEARLAEAEDQRALQEIFETERHLLYVAATRARDRLWISGVAPVSEFLSDLLSQK